MKYPKSSQYKYAKSPYRIRKWPEYEAGLGRRGDLTIWFSDDAINSWWASPSGKPGGQRTYANTAPEVGSGWDSAVARTSVGNAHPRSARLG